MHHHSTVQTNPNTKLNGTLHHHQPQYLRRQQHQHNQNDTNEPKPWQSKTGEEGNCLGTSTPSVKIKPIKNLHFLISKHTFATLDTQVILIFTPQECQRQGVKYHNS